MRHEKVELMILSSANHCTMKRTAKELREIFQQKVDMNFHLQMILPLQYDVFPSETGRSMKIFLAFLHNIFIGHHTVQVLKCFFSIEMNQE